MIISYRIPEGICVHNRDAWKHLAQENGIDFDKKMFVYRDFKTGQYVVGQEVDGSCGMDNGR